MIVRFDRWGLAWPVPSEIGDMDVERRLYGASGVKPGRRKLTQLPSKVGIIFPL
jgi:hypothetical protein